MIILLAALSGTCPLSIALAYTDVCPAEMSVAFHCAALSSTSVPSFHLSELCCVTSASRCTVLCYCSVFWANLSLVFFSSNVLQLAYR